MDRQSKQISLKAASRKKRGNDLEHSRSESLITEAKIYQSRKKYSFNAPLASFLSHFPNKKALKRYFLRSKRFFSFN